MGKKLPDRYVYPVVFTFYGQGKEIAAVFPDLDAATSGVDEQDVFFSARELLGCVMNGLEEDGEEIVPPTPLEDVKVGENQRAALIDVYMPSIRMANNNRAVNRTVTLPAWLNATAQEHGFNFSQVLQEALKAKLSIQ